MRSFRYSLLVVRAFGYRVNVGRRQERWLKWELWVRAVMSSSSSVLSLPNAAGWPERVGRLCLLSQSCSCAPTYYFPPWENSHGPSRAGAASWLHRPGPLARCWPQGSPCDVPFPCHLQASGTAKTQPPGVCTGIRRLTLAASA